MARRYLVSASPGPTAETALRGDRLSWGRGILVVDKGSSSPERVIRGHQRCARANGGHLDNSGDQIMREPPRIECPHCQQRREDLQKMANHLIAHHPKTAEAGAAYTSLARLDDLLRRKLTVEEQEEQESNANQTSPLETGRIGQDRLPTSQSVG